MIKDCPVQQIILTMELYLNNCVRSVLFSYVSGMIYDEEKVGIEWKLERQLVKEYCYTHNKSIHE